MKKFIGFVIGFILFIAIIISCVATNNKKELKENIEVLITVKKFGEITLSLDPNVAPITVDNFVKLAKSGFYENTTFHRIMEGFMIQGGAAKDGSKEPSTIKGEFRSNGVKNNISHKRGVISMARTSLDMNSASSQFFIVQKDSPHLDGEYAAFGHVTKGIEVVDAIAKSVTPIDNNGTILEKEQPIIEKVEVIENEENNK